MTASSTDETMLGIYLNDHLVAADAAVAVADRLAGAQSHLPGGGALQRLATDIAWDRNALVDLMSDVEVPVRRYKRWGVWAAEKVARLKPNGRLVARSPLSRVVELEAIRLGVVAKAAGWRTLQALAESDPRLDAEQLDTLAERAEQHLDHLETLRVGAVAEAFGGDAQPSM